MKKNTKISSGFNIPPSYFNNVEEHINTQIYLERIKIEPFKTPKDYFKNFNTTQTLTPLRRKTVKLHKTHIFWSFGIAASLLLLLNLNIFKNTFHINDVASDALENYLVDEVNTLDLTLLHSNYTLTETEFTDINTTTIVDYLDDLDVDELIEN